MYIRSSKIIYKLGNKFFNVDIFFFLELSFYDFLIDIEDSDSKCLGLCYMI